MGRFGVTLDEMKESTRAFFKNQREQARNKRNPNRISNYQQSEKKGETPSQSSSNSFQKKNQGFDAGLFLILTTITGAFLFLFSPDFRMMTHELLEKGIERVEMLSMESIMVAGIVVTVCIIALISRRK